MTCSRIKCTLNCIHENLWDRTSVTCEFLVVCFLVLVFFKGTNKCICSFTKCYPPAGISLSCSLAHSVPSEHKRTYARAYRQTNRWTGRQSEQTTASCRWWNSITTFWSCAHGWMGRSLYGTCGDEYAGLHNATKQGTAGVVVMNRLSLLALGNLDLTETLGRLWLGEKKGKKLQNRRVENGEDRGRKEKGCRKGPLMTDNVSASCWHPVNGLGDDMWVSPSEVLSCATCHFGLPKTPAIYSWMFSLAGVWNLDGEFQHEWSPPREWPQQQLSQPSHSI